MHITNKIYCCKSNSTPNIQQTNFIEIQASINRFVRLFVDIEDLI